MFWPTNSFPATSATASASSPFFTGTLLRTNSTALSLSGSYARKERTFPGFPSESKVVTRTFHPAGIPALCAAVVAGQYPATIKLTHYPPTTLLPQTSRTAFHVRRCAVMGGVGMGQKEMATTAA